MRFALYFLWRDRKRYLPGVLAVATSSVLIALQAGIMLGLPGMASALIDCCQAQIWVSSPRSRAVNDNIPLARDRINAVWVRPEVAHVEECLLTSGHWEGEGGPGSTIILVGCHLGEDAVGPAANLTLEQRRLLIESFAVVIHAADRERLGVSQVGDRATVNDQRVRVVGFTEGIETTNLPFLLCSLATVRRLDPQYTELRTGHLLVNCHDPEQVPATLQSLRRLGKVRARTGEEFSRESQIFWIRNNKAATAIVIVAVVGLLVGLAVTIQTLYSATLAMTKEFAILRAMGVPGARLRRLVVQLAFFIGLAGLTLGVPLTFALARVARLLGTKALLPWWLMAATAGITLVMALLAGLVALRSLRHTNPAQLLR